MNANPSLAEDPTRYVKCPCNHCREKIEFDANHAGVPTQCPHCGMDTLLFIPKILRIEPVSKPQPPPAPPEPIESWLDGIGIGYMIFSVFGCLGCFIIATQHPGDDAFVYFGAALGVLAQGFLVKALLNAIAEIIRLLRAIAKPAAPK